MQRANLQRTLVVSFPRPSESRVRIELMSKTPVEPLFYHWKIFNIRLWLTRTPSGPATDLWCTTERYNPTRAGEPRVSASYYAGGRSCGLRSDGPPRLRSASPHAAQGWKICPWHCGHVSPRWPSDAIHRSRHLVW